MPRPLAALLAAALLAATAPAQSTYTYSTSSVSNAWLSQFNWTGGSLGKYPGVTTAANAANGNANDKAVIGNRNFGNELGIDMGTAGGQLSAGGIEFNPTTNSNVLTIFNNSPTTGFLRLNGSLGGTSLISVSGIANLYIRSSSISTGGGIISGFRLGITNGVFNVVTGRFLTVGVAITEVNANSGFTVQGGGTIVVLFNNTYTGITTISASTLQVGDGVTGGSLGTGAVINNGNLKFNKDTLTFANVISGSGSVTNFGLTVLTGDNTYSGGTTISSGTLTIGNGLTSGSFGTGAVTNNSVLRFIRSNAMTVSNVISGTGSVTMMGSGILTLTGSNSYGGATSVSSGTLRVNGDNSGATGAVSVDIGATLGGTGTVGGAVTVSGGILAPGNGVGTLRVDNNVRLWVTSPTFQAELGATAGDQLNMFNGANTLYLRSDTHVNLVNSGFDGSTIIYTLADLQGTGASLLQVDGANVAPGSTITTFTSTGGNSGTVTKVQGDVNITLTGFNLTAGDTLTVRRTAGGDLVVVFTPVPEPGTVLGVCALAAGGVAAWRRWRTKPTATPAG